MASKNSSSAFKLITLLTIIVFAAIAIIVVISSNNKEESNDNDIVYDQSPSIKGQPVLGEEAAPVQVVEFGDFKCPACKAWGENIYPQLVEDYVNTGKVQFSYMNVLFHGDESKLGSVAAEAVLNIEPDSYWDFHKGLFAKQPGDDHDSQWLTMDAINEVAGETTSIAPEALLAEMQTKEVIEAVNVDTTLVNEYEVQLTPSIMINDKMLEDPFDYEQIKRLIDQALEEQE
ncbi:DsbA family protein [Cytobacillus horneckiae]|uniref:DsbA family protein n=1 Tax=Cytobacillus horneckiae TaxID=549687 RepID=UPI002042340C|nr:thioredoxin domain-containing protein [Cytobacillus horneckiae]MCM3180601.1 DsbA family protein [Cytobacillus horneckiae]